MSHLEFAIAVESDVDDRGSLLTWITDDPAIRRTTAVRIGPAAQPASGAMGASLEDITGVADTVIALSALIVSIATWRQAHHRPPRISIRRGATVIEVESADREEAERIARKLESAGES